jgi:hypothetical protein
VKEIGIEEKLHVIMRHEKGERSFYISSNVRLAHSSVHTVRVTADRTKESVKAGNKLFVCVARLPQS